MLGRFLHGSGVDLGDDLLGPGKGNAFGHFEDREIIAFHQDILWRDCDDDIFATRPPRLGADDATLAAELVRRRVHKPRWGFKDPRASLFLDLWLTHCPAAVVLFPVRHPMHVVDSLRRRQGSPTSGARLHDLYLRTWITYNWAGLRARLRHGGRVMVVHLHDFVRAPHRFVEELGRRLELELSAETFNGTFDKESLAMPDTAPQLPASAHLRLTAEALYAALRRISEPRP